MSPVSVLIPAHNEEKHITSCIASILGTGWPRDKLQILVIDHSSTDSTAKLARISGAEVLHISAGKIGAVRNVGLAAARGQFVAYVDGDCSVPPTWLLFAIRLLESDASIGAVGGPCLSPSDGTWVERSLAPSAIDPDLTGPAKALATSSFIARTSLLRELGGFNDALVSGEDDDMSNRIRARGLALVSASKCHIIHYGYPKTWWDALKKEIWHGSHHIEVRTRFDLTLILTFVFLAASATLPILLATAVLISRQSLYALASALFFQSVPPLLFVAKRIRQSVRDWRLTLPLLAVGYAYFTGHSFGVLANLWRRTTSRLQRPATVGGSN